MFTSLEAFNSFFFPCLIAIILIVKFDDEIDGLCEKYKVKKRQRQEAKRRHNIRRQNNRAAHGKNR